MIFSLLLVLTHKFPAGGSPAAEHARTGHFLFHFLLVYWFKKGRRRFFAAPFFSLFFYCARFLLCFPSLSLNAFFPFLVVKSKPSVSSLVLDDLQLGRVVRVLLDLSLVVCFYVFFFRLNAEVVEKAMSVFFFVRDV